VLEVRQTEEFRKWRVAIKDNVIRQRIGARIDRLAFGNFGDVKPVGDGVSELRLDFGSGYRLYFIRRGSRLVVLLCGGDKSSQSRDIDRARRMAQQVED
jgi:putative addiction module killer protein